MEKKRWSAMSGTDQSRFCRRRKERLRSEVCPAMTRSVRQRTAYSSKAFIHPSSLPVRYRMHPHPARVPDEQAPVRAGCSYADARRVQALVNDRCRPEASGSAVKVAALPMVVRGACPLDGVYHGADAFKRQCAGLPAVKQNMVGFQPFSGKLLAQTGQAALSQAR